MALLDILLVDDDPDFASTAAELLRQDGHRVTTAPDGASAIKLAHDLQPDAVLLDLNLPDTDGYDVARVLRTKLPDISPIIVVTGQRLASQREDVDLLLCKPVPSELFGGLIEYIRSRRRSRVMGGVVRWGPLR